MSDSLRQRSPLVFPTSSFRYTPLEHVRTVLVGFVQGLFAQAPAGEYRWDPDEDKTEIIIRDENILHPEVIGARPAVNLSRGAIQFYGLGFDDVTNYQATTGKKTKAVLIPGTHTIHVSSRSEIEADNLAWVIAEHIWLLRDLLMQQGFYEIGRNISIGAPSQPNSIVQGDAGEEWYLVSISVPWQFPRQSAMTPLGKPILESIELNIQAKGKVVQAPQGWPDADFELPVNIQREFPPPYADTSDAYNGTPNPLGTRQDLHKQPHPLNPAQTVTVKTIKPYRSTPKRGTPI